jgi:uncharacterized membrane protein
MKNKLFYASLTLSIIVLIINIIALPMLPGKVPVHWNFNGEVDRYGSKAEHLFIGVLPLLLFILLNYLPRIDPKKASFQKHSKAYSVINFFIILFISAMNLVALCSAMGYDVNFSVILPVFLGILFIGTGNYMAQLRPNYLVGFRTPWALASDYVWRKTHRFGGFVFVLIGIISIALAFFSGKAMIPFLVMIGIGILSIYIYSYVIFKKQS